MKKNYSMDYGDFGDNVWLNCAHQGPLSKVAVMAAYETINWKINPHKITDESFWEIPKRLKKVLGKLINVSPDEIILGNSASYGIHLLANGLPLRKGDEVILVKGDFPTNILPWLGLKEKGINCKFIEPVESVLQSNELLENISDSTKVICISWVNSFNGGVIDIESIGEICRKHKIKFILNCSQGIGALPFDIDKLPVDAITCVGFKWLCGPYGTGFCWIKSELLDSLNYNQAYWLAMQTADDLNSEREVELKTGLGAKKYDIFGTANFFNFKPLTVSIEYLLECGIENIHQHNNKLTLELLSKLDERYFLIKSPAETELKSSIVVISHRKSFKNKQIYQMLKNNKIEIALRSGNLRISPHLYNTKEDIDKCLEVLHSLGEN